MRFGVVGLGRMGLNHIRVLTLLKGAEIRCVCDSDTEARQRIAGSLGARGVGEIEEMFGLVPSMFKVVPDNTLDLEWQLFKRVQLW